MPAAVKADLAKNSPIEQTEIRRTGISVRRRYRVRRQSISKVY